MNSREYVKKIKPFIVESNALDLFEISDLYNIIEAQSANSVVFVKVTERYPAEYFKNKAISDVIYITNKKIGFHNEVVIEDKNWNEAKKILLDVLYPETSSKLVGITGTNGKTSTAYYLNQLLSKKYKTLYCGTLGNYEGTLKIHDSKNTTPDFIEIRKMMSRDYDYIIFEVSSHALTQDRFYKIYFDLAAWTNFSQDHLDFHLTMKDYFETKTKIFSKLKEKSKCFIFEQEKDLIDKLKKQSKLEIAIIDKKFDNYFELANKNLAFAMAKSLIVEKDLSLTNLEDPPGRFMRFKLGSNLVIIDYAHTPDALQAVLKEARNYQKPVVCVFGCGGDRDRSKRPLMGKIAEQGSDYVLLTEDNNRNEAFTSIVSDIIKGMKKTPKSIENREQAIEEVCRNHHGSVIVIAGKGHEDTIINNGVITKFSDIQKIRELSNEKV